VNFLKLTSWRKMYSSTSNAFFDDDLSFELTPRISPLSYSTPAYERKQM
jgi:hypothetical protein